MTVNDDKIRKEVIKELHNNEHTYESIIDLAISKTRQEYEKRVNEIKRLYNESVDKNNSQYRDGLEDGREQQKDDIIEKVEKRWLFKEPTKCIFINYKDWKQFKREIRK